MSEIMLRSYFLGLSKTKSLKRMLPVLSMVVLVASGLACSWGGFAPPKAKPVVIRINLPTLTPTSRPLTAAALPTPTPTNFSPAAATPTAMMLAPLPTATFTPVVAAIDNQEQAPPSETAPSPPTNPPPTNPPPTSTPTSIPTATTVPNPSANPTPTVTPIPETAGWSFAKIRTYDNQYEGGLILYGEMVNDTGAPQEIAYITGAFYDGQGQLIADSDSTTEYWPIEIIPPGGRTPFELAVNGIQAVANFRLWANSATAGHAPRQDFQIDGVEQWQADEDYCLAGQLQNPGGDLTDFLVITAVLYDDHGDVVNFGETYEPGLDGGETLDFEICIDPPNQNAAHHELRAWGQ